MSPRRNPTFLSPKDAIETLLEAYQAMDVDALVAAKDFAIDAKLFWEGLGLPVSDKQMKDSEAAFESNFRKQMDDEGIPDYRGMEHSISAREDLQDNLVVLTLQCRLPDRREAQMRLPVFKTQSGWKAVRLPPYDHL